MSLKRELENPASPLRVALEARLPDLVSTARNTWNPAIKGAQAAFNPTLPADVLGHAISERVAWQFTGTSGMPNGLNVLAAAGAHPDVLDGLIEAMLDPVSTPTGKPASHAWSGSPTVPCGHGAPKSPGTSRC